MRKWMGKFRGGNVENIQTNPVVWVHHAMSLTVLCVCINNVLIEVLKEEEGYCSISLQSTYTDSSGR